MQALETQGQIGLADERSQAHLQRKGHAQAPPFEERGKGLDTRERAKVVIHEVEDRWQTGGLETRSLVRHLVDDEGQLARLPTPKPRRQPRGGAERTASRAPA